MNRRLIRAVLACAALAGVFPAAADPAPEPDPCLVDPTLPECADREVSSADDVHTYQDYHRKLRSSEMVSPLGSDVFGEGTSLYNGATEFTVVDIDLPGAGPPVQLRRRFEVQARKTAVLGGFGAWDIDVPYLYGVFDGTYKWDEYFPNPNNPDPATRVKRCSSLWSPRVRSDFSVGDIWSGTHLHLPGQGDREMLSLTGTSQPVPTDGAAYRWTTRDNLRLSCKPTTGNGYPGEGFIAVDGVGTRYTFDIGLERGHGMVNLMGARHARTRVYLMASEVLDRHGNWVRYHYSGDRLTGITGSDGRAIQLTYTDDRITRADAHGRFWTYVYPAGQTIGFPANAAARWLSEVIRPDGSRWTYGFSHSGGMGALRPFYPQHETGEAGCPAAGPGQGRFTMAVTHPGGATGTFQFDLLRHYRGGVPQHVCHVANGSHVMGVADYSDTFSLVDKTVTGPGITPMTWAYGYGGGPHTRPPALLPCTGEPSDLAKTTTVISPDQGQAIHTFGVQHACNDGRLLGVEIRSPANVVLRRQTHAYVTEAQAPSMPFAPLIGTMSGSQDPSTSRLRPITSTVIHQQSVNFASTVNAFDAFARPVSVTKASPFGSKTEYTTYHDVLTKWVVGQVSSVRVPRDGVDTWPVEHLFDPVSHQPRDTFAFQKLVDRRTYHPDGQLWTISDPGGVKKTALSNYWRGIPRSVVHHDDSTQSATVSDHGEILSVTDETLATTTYTYDPMGRLTRIRHPQNDSVPWADTTIAFAPVASCVPASACLGLGVGHWRQTVSTGNARTVTDFDGLWRPVLTRSVDLADEAATRTMVQRRFDHANRDTFVSWPQAAIAHYNAPVDGVATTYDALGRPLQTVAAAEAGVGPLVTSHAYLSLFRTQVTDPRGYVTTTSFQAFDQPATDAPRLIQSPAGVSTTIARDLFGKPTSLTRSGPWEGGTLSAVRRYVYDGHERLCKIHDPEADWTVMDYDASNNLAWTTTGANLPSLTDCQRDSVAVGDRSTRSYDGRNRLITLDHPAGTDDITHSYFADGALKTIATGTGGTWTYAYNKRRLPTAETLVVNGLVLNVGHTYTTTGHRDSLAYPDGTVLAFDPDALGRPTRIGSHATQLAYHPNGSVAGFRYGNGVVHSQALNTRQLPAHRREMRGGTVVMDLDHHYDGNGNLSHRQDSDGGIDESRWMDYDGLDRLTWADAPGVLGSAEYTYDPLDNLRRINFDGGVRVPQSDHYRYDANNRLYQIYRTTGALEETVPYGYDDRGNMTLRGVGGHLHVYDRANRMLEATTPSGKETYRYDGHGRRTTIARAAGSTLQLYSRDGQLLYERAPGGQETRHIHLGGRLIASVPGLPPGVPPDTIFASGFETGEAAFGPVYQHTDTLGSIVKRTGAGGNVIGVAPAYEPYGSLGNLAAVYEQRPGFTGHMTDAASTLTYMQQRFYDSTAMRFLSVDPVPVSPVDGSNFSRYWYANNNPYRYVDPDGRQACGKDTGCRLAGGAYGGFSGMMNSARAIDATNRARAVQQQAINSAIRRTTEEVVPGVGCANNGCSGGEWVLEAATILPIAKFAKFIGEASRAIDSNKLRHIFGKPSHNLDDVVSAFGSQQAAFEAMERGVQSALSAGRLAPDSRGVFETVVNIGGANVTVSGRVVDGVARIGSAWQ